LRTTRRPGDDGSADSLARMAAPSIVTTAPLGDPMHGGTHSIQIAQLAQKGTAVLALAALVALGCGHRAHADGRIDWSAAAPPETSPAASERIERYGPLVERAARAHGLDPALVAAVVWTESRFDPAARSPAGAVGLMQLMPATARGIARRLGRPVHRRRPASNLEAGCYYLRRMIDRFDGSVRWGLAAYHAGPGNAARYRRRGRLPAATARYVRAVLDARASFARGRDTRFARGPARPRPDGRDRF